MTHPIRTLLLAKTLGLARAVAYLNRYHLEDGALPRARSRRCSKTSRSAFAVAGR